MSFPESHIPETPNQSLSSEVSHAVRAAPFQPKLPLLLAPSLLPFPNVPPLYPSCEHAWEVSPQLWTLLLKTHVHQLSRSVSCVQINIPYLN